MNIIIKIIIALGLGFCCYYGYKKYYCADICKPSSTDETTIIETNKPIPTDVTVTQKEEESMILEKITTPTGLAYEIITKAPADALLPKTGQTVSVHYTGWLNENGQPGKKFDSSVDRGQQFQFPVGMGYVIAGWDQAVADMKIGEKRRVYIPSALGYGARGAGAAIPPHADLIFDIELFDIQ